MKVLVTGGLGFIGSNFIIQMLEDPKNNIINIDKIGVGSNIYNLKRIEKNSNYEFIQGDISNPKNLNIINQDIDIVVNFAAETHVDRSIANPEKFLESNYIGTFHLLEAERKNENSILHIQVSTDEVYGDILSGSHTEEDLLRPSNPYSATKAASDLLCNAYHRTYGNKIIITRCTNNFGPRQYTEKLIPKTIKRALENQQIPIYGTGENVRDWLFVKDHCSAIKLLIELGESGEIYNISAGNELSVNTIVTKTLDYLEKPHDLMVNVEDRSGHDIRYSLDSSKLRKLGWEPKFIFEKALQETINWYLENENYWRPL